MRACITSISQLAYCILSISQLACAASLTTSIVHLDTFLKFNVTSPYACTHSALLGTQRAEYETETETETETATETATETETETETVTGTETETDRDRDRDRGGDSERGGDYASTRQE